MSEYAYILIAASLVVLFLINKYEKERLQKILTEQLLKDENFKAIIREQIQTSENINDVLAYINKTYHIGLTLAKEITDELK